MPLKKKILFLAFSLQLLVAVAQTNFISPASNYTYTIPNGWKNATKSEINEFAQQSGQMYDAILYPSHKKQYDGPPILTSIFKSKAMKPSEYEGIANELLKTFKTDMDQFIPKDLTDQIKSFKPGQGYYNKKSASLIYIYESEIKSIGKFYNIVAGFFTPKGLIMIQFVDRSANYTKNIDSYVKLVSSLKR
jgi:hypothetical protein